MNTQPRLAHVPGFHEDPPFRASALPHSLFRTLRIRTSGSGEMRLAVAILEDAVHCLERHRNSRDFTDRLLRWEAEEWFRSTDSRPLFSFENICRLLDLDAPLLREHLRHWREGRAGGPISFRRIRAAAPPARGEAPSPGVRAAAPAPPVTGPLPADPGLPSSVSMDAPSPESREAGSPPRR